MRRRAGQLMTAGASGVVTSAMRSDLTQALHSATLTGVQRGVAPTRSLRAGHRVFRAVPADKPYTHAYGAATIPPNSSTSTGNRFSGARADESQGHGALYVGSSNAMMAEIYHYYTAGIQSPYALQTIANGGSNIDQAFFDKRVFEFQLRPSVEVLDIARMPDFLLQDAELRKLTQECGVSVESLLADDDHIFARSVSHEVFDASAGLGGVAARTVRHGKWHHLTDRSFDGDNVALFGADGQVLHRTLEPVRMWSVSDIVHGRAAVTYRDMRPGDLLESLNRSGVRDA